MAIMPGVTIIADVANLSLVNIFFIVSILVVIISFIGLLMSLFISLQNRQRELAILRTMGAYPIHLFVF